MAGRRRIAFVTGTRAEYGLLKSSLRASEQHPALRMQLLVTGMHLLQGAGYTVRDIIRDGWPIDARVKMHQPGDHVLVHSRALAKGVDGLAKHIHALRSDIVVVLGDRVEALAGALAASTVGCALAHIHGGDTAPGYLDESFRHAITKLAHIHLAASKQAAKRIIRMGEHSRHVHVVGAPGLDDLRVHTRPPREWLVDTFEFSGERDVALILQHPIGRRADVEKRVMSRILRAVLKAGLDGLVIYPNNDPGYSGIIKAIQRAPQARRLRCARSLPRDEFLSAMMSCRLMIGNSSSGIIEAHSARVPVVNIGSRQDGRLRAGRAIVDCSEKYEDVGLAIRQALSSHRPRASTSAYGRGRAGEQIANVLAKTPLSDNLKRKRNSY